MAAMLLGLKRLRFAVVERLRYAGFSYVVGGVVASVAAVAVLFTATPAGQVLQGVAATVLQEVGGQTAKPTTTPPAAPTPTTASLATRLEAITVRTPIATPSPVPQEALTLPSAVATGEGSTASPVSSGPGGGGGTRQTTPASVPAASRPPSAAPDIVNPPVATATTLVGSIVGAVASITPLPSPTITLQTPTTPATPMPQGPVQALASAATKVTKPLQSPASSPAAPASVPAAPASLPAVPAALPKLQ